jgi:hypothetical protein
MSDDFELIWSPQTRFTFDQTVDDGFAVEVRASLPNARCSQRLHNSSSCTSVFLLVTIRAKIGPTKFALSSGSLLMHQPASISNHLYMPCPGMHFISVSVQTIFHQRTLTDTGVE